MIWPAASTISAAYGCDPVSDDLVKAEAHAVRALRHAVGRYAEQIREAVVGARREVTAADRRAHEAAEHRRSEFQRREQELKAAQAALAQCLRASGPDCDGLRQQVSAAAQRHAEARQSLDRARKAAQTTAAAQSDLVKVLQAVEATIGEHSSIASSALASLDAKLAELPHPGIGHTLQGIAAGALVGAEIAIAGMDLSRIGGDAAAPFNVNPPVRDHSISQAAEHQAVQELFYLAEKNAEDPSPGDTRGRAEGP